MPPNPNSSGSFEETLAKETLYQSALDEAKRVPSADVLWEQRIGWGVLGSYATETRKRLITLLGEKKFNELVGENTKKLTAEITSKLVGHMVETNHGVHALLEDVLKDPKDVKVTMPSGQVKLDTLIKDPESKEARMLAWYMERVAKRSAADKAAAFNFISNTVEAKRLAALIKARKLYEALSKDEENFDIGITGSGPNTQIGRIEKRKTAAETKLSGLQSTMATAKPKVAVLYQPQIDRVEESIDKMDGEVYNLDKKRTALKGKLDEFEAAMKQVDPTFTLATDRAEKLNKANLDADVRASTLTFSLAGGHAHRIYEYLTDDTLRKKTDGFASALARGGTQKPLARDALLHLMEIEYEDALKDMTPEQRSAFLQNVQSSLSTATGESAKKDDLKKKEDGDDTKEGGGSWFSTLISKPAAGVWDYLTETDGKNILGFDVENKKK